jgi:hypothetical protein
VRPNSQPLSDPYAHALPLTRIETSEVFLCDIAGLPAYQQQGLGREFVMALRA